MKVLVPLLLTATILTAAAGQAPLELQQGDRVVLLGNALAERMQHHGWLESYVQAALPESELVFRNHGFSGDRVAHRPRNKGFIGPHDYLKISQADVVLAFFGYNESFDTDPEAHTQALVAWIDETRAQQYNGESAPRIVLFSPIAHEPQGDPNRPDPMANNLRLARMRDATAKAARERDVPHVDLFELSSALYSASTEPLTLNGVHLTSEGNRQLARKIVEELFQLPLSEDEARVEAIRQAVLDKNWHWFNRYRATDGNDIWGSRGPLKFVDQQTNADVLWHELDMIDVMTANRDQVVWAEARGLDQLRADDSNVPAPIRVKTNVGGGSPSSSAAKEGQPQYMPPEDSVAQLELAEGLEANVFASEAMFPELANPVQLGVDTRGRLWVAAWKTYPKWEPLQEMSDRLLILPDEDRDGVADRAITFAKVHNPTGFEFWGNGVIVASAPDLIYLEDTDGDDVADVRIRILHGLDSADTHHAANNLTYGPDGFLYYQRGVFLVSNVETPWVAAQQSGVSGMYRFNPRTYEFSFHARNSPNPHGIGFDHWGYHFATDGTGGNAYQVVPREDGTFHMRHLLKKTVRPVPSSGVLSSAHFPPEYDGNFLILNTIGFLGIKQYTLERTEEGLVNGTETVDLLVSRTDRNFRPTDFEVGDDGALYVSDWQNIIIGHMQHNVRDPSRDKEFGRVIRVTAKDRPLMEHVPVAGRPTPELLDLLTHPTNGIRKRVHIELSARDSREVVAAVAEWVQQWDPDSEEHAHHLLEALWIHQQHNIQNEALLGAVLASPVPHARNAAQRVQTMWSRSPRQITLAGEEIVEVVKPQKTAVDVLRGRGFTDDDLRRYDVGAEVYMREAHCATCHQRDGKGLAGLYPPIAASEWVSGNEERLIKITLEGLWGELTVDGFTYNSPTTTTPPMTPFKGLLDDEEIAGVLTYVRNTFGNEAAPVQPERVAEIRKANAGREGWYMADEILREHPFTEEERHGK